MAGSRGEWLKILKELSTNRWRAFLDEVPEANVHQTPEMRDAWARTKNYEPIVVCVEDEGEIRHLILASLMKEGEGLKGSFSSRVITTGGPITRGGDIREVMNAFDEIVGPKALFSEIRNLWGMSAHRHALEELGYSYEGHLNFVHDLTRPPSEIWGGFSSNRKKNIKKAESRGIVVREGDTENIDTFYEMVSRTYEEAKVLLADKSLFESMWRVMRPSNMARLFLAMNEGRILAGRMVLMYRDVIYDWYAGSSPTAKDENANQYLVWHVLKWGRENGFKRFDFGGAGKPGKHYGPGEFKRRFGGTQTDFGRFEKVYHPVKHFVGRKGFELLRRLG